jgi:hypothetical protein
MKIKLTGFIDPGKQSMRDFVKHVRMYATRKKYTPQDAKVCITITLRK